MNIIENMFRFCKELEYHIDHLSSLVRNDDSWDAHRAYDFSEISNNALFLKNEIIELDKLLNGVDDFERKTLDIARKAIEPSSGETPT